MKKEQPTIQVVVRVLVDWLGAGLVGEMCGADGPAHVKRWQVQAPGPEEEEKLRTGYKVFRILRSEEGVETAMAWMMGMNPLLENHSECRTSDGNPITEIGLGYGSEVVKAAQAHVQDPMLT